MKTKLQELQDLRDDLAYLKVELISLCKSMKLDEAIKILASDILVGEVKIKSFKIHLGDFRSLSLDVWLDFTTQEPDLLSVYAHWQNKQGKESRTKVYQSLDGKVQAFRPGSWTRDLLEAAKVKKAQQQSEKTDLPVQEELSQEEEKKAQRLIDKLLREKENWEPFDFPVVPEENIKGL